MANLVVPPFESFTKVWHSSPYAAISPTHTDLSVAGKTVVVTGGGTGIGKAIARAFAQAGASSVAVLGRREDRLKDAVQEIKAASGGQGVQLLYQVVDLTDRQATKAALKTIVEGQGGEPIDIFVNNAGQLPTPGAAVELDEEAWMKGFDINFRTTLNAVHAFVPLAAKGATLLNISTGLVHMQPMPGVASHVATKAAAMKFIDYVQAENPELHVVSVQPGVVETESSRDTGVEGQDDVDLPGHFCVWLASKQAKFLRGKFVWANWDVDELVARAEEIQSSRVLTIMLDGVPM